MFAESVDKLGRCWDGGPVPDEYDVHVLGWKKRHGPLLAVARKKTDPPLEVDLELRAVEGRLRLVRADIHSEDGMREISAAEMRALPIASILARVRADLAAIENPPAGTSDPGDQISAAFTASEASRRRGRPRYGDDHHRMVAEAYLSLLAQGMTRGVLDHLAAEFSERFERPVPKETVRSWIYQARKAQYLTGGEQGRAGAQPGPRLRAKRGKR